MNNLDLDISSIKDIIKKTIGKIDESREHIFRIIDSIHNEHENLKIEIAEIKKKISAIIEEVDELEKKDKAAREDLAEVSANFNIYSEGDIKAAYENAANIRIKFAASKSEEKVLRDKRDQLEMSLKKSVENIKVGEKIINQVSIALGYLEGDILTAINNTDKNSEMFIGIKILEAQENERKRIARDIHDGPAQHLSNVIMNVDICTKVIQDDLKRGLDELSDLKESVKTALKEVRSIIYDLRPMSLDDLGLNQTISEMVNEITRESGIEIELKLRPIKEEIEPIIQVAVYRIIQEVFNNIKKHSKARHAEVKLDFGLKYLKLIITDDGFGFDVQDTLSRVKSTGTSYGLIGILDRVNQLQGEIQIKSTIGKGTVYNVKLPVSREVIEDEKRGN